MLSPRLGDGEKSSLTSVTLLAGSDRALLGLGPGALTFLELGEHPSLLLHMAECKGSLISPQLLLQALTFIFSSQTVPAASLQKAECSAHPKCSQSHPKSVSQTWGWHCPGAVTHHGTALHTQSVPKVTPKVSPSPDWGWQSLEL